MDAQHTPGPWTWATGEDGEYRFLKGDGLYVLSPESEQSNYGLSSKEWVDVSDANARLIAAAPALAEELREARTTLSILRTQIMVEIRRGVDRWEGVPEKLQERLDAIDAVLATSETKGLEQQ